MSVKAPFEAETLRADLEIKRADIDEAFLHQAGLFAHYASKHVEAMRQESRLKMMLEVTEARLNKAIRDELAAAGEKIVEKAIEARIPREVEYVRALNLYNEAKAMTALAASGVEAFRQRRDMLIQLGANDRHELKGELVARQRAEVGEELKSRMAPAGRA